MMRPTQITEKTKFAVSLNTLGLLLAALCGGVWASAMFVSDIKTDIHDLKRDMALVKHKLKIENDPSVASSGVLIESAEAQQRKH